MPHRTQGRVHRHIVKVMRDLDDKPGLAFSDLLSADLITDSVEEIDYSFRERIFTPMVTVWVFLSQILSSDHSCRDAVARLAAFRSASRQDPCAPGTSSYCDARRRLPVELFRRITRAIGRQLQEEAPQDWLWKGRSVKIIDGTTVSMPDTRKNQEAFPQANTQQPGVGFPVARCVVLFSLACGTALEMAMGPYKGKETGENSLFRTFYNHLNARDIVVGDRYYGSYCDVAMLQDRDVDVVVRKHQLRQTDYRRARRLGRGDYLVVWDKPKQRPDWMDEVSYQKIPDQLTMREVQIQVQEKGKRVKHLTVVTTLLDHREYRTRDIAELYRTRWNAELDLRSLKTTLQMDVLRCKTPDMVRKEMWAHLLTYNLIRTMMAQTAHQYELLPRQISFKGALQTINAHRGYHGTSLADDPHMIATMLHAIASHRVGNRPGRVEPRAIKRRSKPHPLLNMPRREARRRILEGTYA